MGCGVCWYPREKQTRARALGMYFNTFGGIGSVFRYFRRTRKLEIIFQLSQGIEGQSLDDAGLLSVQWHSKQRAILKKSVPPAQVSH